MEKKEIIESLVIKIPARGVRFISGIASRYDDNYPLELQGYITGIYWNVIKFDFEA